MQTIERSNDFLQISKVICDDLANVTDVGKSLAFCNAPEWMMGGKKRTRKSDEGKREDR